MSKESHGMQCHGKYCLCIKEKKGNPTWCKPNSKPPGEGHDWVVVDMKKCHLAVLLPQHKEDLERDTSRVCVKNSNIKLTIWQMIYWHIVYQEGFSTQMSDNDFATYRVQHLNELWEVVKPASWCHLQETENISVHPHLTLHDRCQIQSHAAIHPHLWRSDLPWQPEVNQSSWPGRSEKSILFPILTSQTEEDNSAKFGHSQVTEAVENAKKFFTVRSKISVKLSQRL